MADKKAIVFVCECGPIIGELVDLDALTEHARGLADVAVVERYPTLCSAEGRKWLTAKLSENPGLRPVFAACTPREHAETLSQACVDAGVNPYLAARANVREQCAWVTTDKDAATRKAADLVDAAVARALENEPLEAPEIECASSVLVVGAGVAGLNAALLMADAGRQVTLVEKEPAIGGKVVLLSELFPDMDCAPCLLEPLMDSVLHHPNIEVLVGAELEELLGYLGNYTARVRVTPRHVDPDGCYACRACSEACPVEVPDPIDENMSMRKAIHIPFAGALPNASVIDESVCLHFNGGDCEACVGACAFAAIDLSTTAETVERHVGGVVLATGFELHAAGTIYDDPAVVTSYGFERILNPDGPTGGEIRVPGREAPATIALVHCADVDGCAPAETCSKTCCLAMAKFAQEISHKLPDARIVEYTFDRMRGGDHYRAMGLGDARPARLEEIALGNGDSLRVEPTGTGRVRISHTAAGAESSLEADLAVLAAPHVAPQDAQALDDALGVATDSSGFALPASPRLKPFCSRIDGIFLAGTVQGPKDVSDSASHGAAAAGAALSALVEGRVLVREAATAQVDPDVCGGCGLCVLSCPYKAISFNAETKRAEVNQLLCHGCGTCVATCPSSAITGKGFTDAQLKAEIRVLSSSSARCR